MAGRPGKVGTTLVTLATPPTVSQIATSPGPGVSGSLAVGFRIGPFRGSGYNEDPFVYAFGLYEGATTGTYHEIPLRVERMIGSWVRFKKILLWPAAPAAGVIARPYVGICDGNSNADMNFIGEGKVCTGSDTEIFWPDESPIFWTPPLSQTDFDGIGSLGAMVGTTDEISSSLKTSLGIAFSAATALGSVYVEFEHAYKGSIGGD